MTNTSNLNKTDWLGVISHLWVLPIIYYFYTIGRFVVNTPYGDDIDLIVGNTANFLAAPDLKSALPYLFTQSAEYQTIFITLSGIISTRLFGYINLSFITLVGNLALFLGVFITVYVAAKSSKEFRLFALIAYLLLGAPVYIHCSLWTNCTIGHFGSIFAAAVVSLLLIRSGIVFFILFELGMLCMVFLHGNGPAMIPIGFLGIWLYQQKNIRGRLMAAHAVLSVLILVAWKVTFDEATAVAMQQSLLTILQKPSDALVLLVEWTLGWTGVWATFGDELWVAMMTGAIEIAFIIYLFARHKKIIMAKYPHLSLMIIFLFMTILGGAAFRFYQGGTVGVFSDRFKVYSVVLFICLLLISLCLLRDKIIFQSHRWLVVFLILVPLCFYYNIRFHLDRQAFLVAYKTQRLFCAQLWEETGEAKPCLWHTDNKALIDKAIGMHILYIDKNGSEPLRCEQPYLKHCWK